MNQTKLPDSGWTQHYDVVKELGDCYASVGDYDQARQCYERAAVLDPDEAGPYIGLAVIAMQNQKWDEAEISLKVARRLDPHSSKVFCGMAMLAEQKDDGAGAFEYYLKSLELDSDNLTALLGLFQTSCKMSDFSRVIHYLEVYLERHPGDTSVMFCLATLNLKQEKPEKAARILKDILLLDETNSEAAKLLEEIDNILLPIEFSGVTR